MQITDPEAFDVLTPTNLQEPFLLFSKLRREMPVYWSVDIQGGQRLWLAEECA